MIKSNKHHFPLKSEILIETNSENIHEVFSFLFTKVLKRRTLQRAENDSTVNNTQNKTDTILC